MITVFDIKRFAVHDGPGIRTTVFLKGCPLRCPWCHNPESHSCDPEEYFLKRKVDGRELGKVMKYGKKISPGELIREILRDRIYYEESGGGVTFSGGEPLLQAEKLLEVLAELGSEGIHRAVDTSGYSDPELMEKTSQETDLFLFDLKLMDPVMHMAYTGVDNLLIHRNADWLLESGKEVVFRIPVIPGVNDTQEESDALLAFLEKRKEKINSVHLLPYHRTGADKYRRLGVEYSYRNLDPPTQAYLEKMRAEVSAIFPGVVIGG